MAANGNPMSRSTLWLGGLVFTFAILGCGILIGHYGIESTTAACSSQTLADETSTSATPMPTADAIRQSLFEELKPDNIRNYLKILTNASHPAGSEANNAVGRYVKEVLQAALGHDNVKEASYDVLLSRPNSTNPSSVRITNANGSLFLNFQTKEYPGNYDGAYFAYAPAGTVTSGIVIYANQATDKDFDHLLQRGLPVNGSIILARFGGFRGGQVERCQKYGARAVLLFLDPSVVAPNGINDSQVYPNGPSMPAVAIQRGSVNNGPSGDPQSFGFVSGTRTKYRTNITEGALPTIPALPIGYGDAMKLFSIMEQRLADLPQTWRPSPFLNYSLGGYLSQNRQITLNVTNYLENAKISNIIATIPGCIEPDRYVILGNHYDAWTFGAIDPNSGTSTLLELARTFGVLRTRDNWCPRRSIILALWDGEEYSLIGSTEWVEENLHIIHERAVAYINADSAVRGQGGFFVQAMPLLTEVIEDATKWVPHPARAANGQSQPFLYQIWKNSPSAEITKLGAASDYASFINMAGVTSVDIGFGDKSGVVGYPAYHTGFETFDYVDRFIDPNFMFHTAVAKVLGEMARSLADSVILPFSLTPFADQIHNSWLEAQLSLASFTGANLTQSTDYHSMTAALALFRRNAKELTDDIERFKVDGRLENPTLVREINDRLMKLERMFLDPNGLPGRPLDRHVLQAPSQADVYSSTSFAGLMDTVATIRKSNSTLEEKLFLEAQFNLHFTKLVQIVDRAARFIVSPSHSLTQTV